MIKIMNILINISMMILSLKEECGRVNHEYLNEGLKGE